MNVFQRFWGHIFPPKPPKPTIAVRQLSGDRWMMWITENGVCHSATLSNTECLGLRLIAVGGVVPDLKSG